MHPDADPASAHAAMHGVRVLVRTDRDAVVVKPAGMSSEAPGTHRREQTLIEVIRAAFDWPGAQLPHRLDRPTRGIVVVARDRDAVAAHNEAIRAGRWAKVYIARCRAAANASAATGDLRALVGEHRAYVRREGRLARVVRSGGDPARMAVQVVAPAPGRAGEFHALIRLDTGRFHQIRVMMAALGAPLVGDADYGGAPGPFYLEHAALTLPTLATGELVRVYDPADPDREEIAEVVRGALAEG